MGSTDTAYFHDHRGCAFRRNEGVVDLRARLYGPATRVLPPAFFERRFARFAQDDYRRAGLVFIHIPRTAGLSILREVYQSEFLRHFTIQQFLEEADDDLRGLPRFTVVRNPWDRAVSAYTLAASGGVLGGAQMLHPKQYRSPEFATFDSFVRGYLARRDVWRLDGVFRPQVYYLGRQDKWALDHIGRFERMDETEAWLSDTLGRPIELGQSNRIPHKPYQEYYTDETRDIVRRAYAADIERFAFEFE